MGFMDMFSGRNQQQPQQPQQMPQQQGQQQQGNQGGMQGPGTIPGQNQQQGNSNGQETQNTLAPFTKLWENPKQGEQGVAPKFQLDPTMLNDISGSMKFLDGMNPQILQAVQQGDANGIIQMVEYVARNVYKTGLQHNSALTDTFVNAHSKFNSKDIAPQVRGQLVSQELAKIPNYNNPAVKTTVDRVAQQVQRQNPEASPAEVAEMTRGYFTAAMSAMGFGGEQGQQNQPGSSQGQEPDWVKWLQTGKAV